MTNTKPQIDYFSVNDEAEGACIGNRPDTVVAIVSICAIMKDEEEYGDFNPPYASLILSFSKGKTADEVTHLETTVDVHDLPEGYTEEEFSEEILEALNRSLWDSADKPIVFGSYMSKRDEDDLIYMVTPLVLAELGISEAEDEDEDEDEE